MSICLALSAIALNNVFVGSGAIDFTELQPRASAGLRDESGPTDLALHFDYRICHLLVDEFQDTSHSQMHFFELLTEGWQADDDNTFSLLVIQCNLSTVFAMLMYHCSLNVGNKA